MAFSLSRRGALAGALGLGSLGLFPGLSFAASAGTAKRFVFVIQRGAADGLALVPPTGDPGFATLRGKLGDDTPIPLDPMFGVHSAMVGTAALFKSGQARAWHAVASPYRDRSHFDGQNVLEGGGLTPFAEKTGWLGRLLPMLPDTGSNALALAPAVPLALRGDRQVATYAPNALPAASDDLLMRVSQLYSEDAQLGPVWDEAMKTRALTSDIGGNNGRNGGDLGRLAATLLAPEDGARVMMIETGGWDTHSGQKNRLANQLRGLDALLVALKDGLGPVWADTMVLVATEFGRTAAVNGTGGTDHGTASAALLLGGALESGRPVISDWPGLSRDSLYEARDLKPTLALDDLISQQLARHYALAPAKARTLFA